MSASEIPTTNPIFKIHSPFFGLEFHLMENILIVLSAKIRVPAPYGEIFQAIISTNSLFYCILSAIF